MKKIIYLLLVFLLAMVISCRGNNENSVIIFTSTEDFRTEHMQKLLKDKFPEYDITVQVLSTGNHAAKLKAEGIHSEADIILNLETGYLEGLQDILADLSSYNISEFLPEMVRKNIVSAKIKEIKSNANPQKKEEELLTTLESCYEYYMRGFDFANIDLYDSDPEKFLPVDEKTLRPPFITVNGLGEAAAQDLAEHRKTKQFISIDDIFTTCPGVYKPNLDKLKTLGALRDLPDSSQMTLF